MKEKNKKNIAKRILEVLSIPVSFKDKKFFYGVSTRDKAKNIWDSGEIPLYLGKKGDKKRTYLSSSLERAFDFAGVEFNGKTPPLLMKNYGRYGYIFFISSSELTDIFPNESDVGRFIQKMYDKQYAEHDLDPKSFDFLKWRWSILLRSEQKDIIYDNLDSYNSIGKKILDSMSDNQMLWLLEKPEFRVTNEGKVFFSSLYRLDRKVSRGYSSELDFFDTCFKVEKREDII